MNNAEIRETTKKMFLNNVPTRSDIIFVFGTRLEEAVLAAVDLYTQGLAEIILFSGGVNKKTGLVEADQMEEDAIASGVPSKAIITERTSTNTLENVVFSLEILRKQGLLGNIQSGIAVTKHFHMRRALMTLARHFPQTISWQPYSYGVYNFNETNWFESDVGRAKTFGEVEKIKKYLAKGDIAEIQL